MCIKVKLDSDSGHAPNANGRDEMCGSLAALAALAAHVKPVRKMNRLTIDKRESLTSSRPLLQREADAEAGGEKWKRAA